MRRSPLRKGMRTTAHVGSDIARLLLEIQAVTLSPKEPYTWASGVRSPIYCDCRRIVSFPDVRTPVEDAWARLVRENWPGAQEIVGVATGGVPHAALVAERLGLPMAYIRGKPKDHGLGKRVEGVLPPQARVVVIEDLVSSGGSLLDAVAALKSEGAQILGASAIFTYEFDVAREAFGQANVPLRTLTTYSEVRDQAVQMGILSSADVGVLEEGMRSIAAELAARR